MAKEIARNVMPSLHNKTHFKAASDLFNNTPLCLQNQEAEKIRLEKIKNSYSTP